MLSPTWALPPPAAKYFEALAVAGFVEKHQQGRNNDYINMPLLALLMRVSGGGQQAS